MKGKRIEGIDCSAPAEQMIQHVLRAQLEAMCGLRKKALNWTDPEGVHDMRVISRRLRSAIRDFEPHLPKARLPITKLRAIAKSLGAVRDEDVAIAALEKLKGEVKGDVAQGIELLIGERRQRRAEARTKLEWTIDPTRLSDFRKDFEFKLENSSSRGARTPLTLEKPKPFTAIGTQVVGARLREFRSESPFIFFPSENVELHELRILAKRLRYAIELFSSCWEDLNRIAKEVALLQTSLGELHDCDVWIDDLGARLKRTARQPPSDVQKQMLAACSWLLQHFAKDRTGHYCDALNRWQQWETDGFLDHLKSVVEKK